MRDRIPSKPNRALIKYEDGREEFITIIRADEPIEDGTPYKKSTILQDETADLLGLVGDDERTANGAFKKIGQKFGILEGAFILDENTEENYNNNKSKQSSILISFPNGYNKDNCVCIGFGTKTIDEFGYNYGSQNEDVYSQRETGAIPKSIVLGYYLDNNKIFIEAFNRFTTSTYIYYKIILMKI